MKRTALQQTKLYHLVSNFSGRTQISWCYLYWFLLSVLCLNSPALFAGVPPVQQPVIVAYVFPQQAVLQPGDVAASTGASSTAAPPKRRPMTTTSGRPEVISRAADTA